MNHTSHEKLMSGEEIETLLKGLAKEVREQEDPASPFRMVGIHTRGIPLAQRLATLLGRDPQGIGTLDINLYRDDLTQARDMPLVRETKIPFSVEQGNILLVDDVLYTGRTVRAAMDALTDFGRPKRISLLALIDRGGREFPIQPDFCGKRIEVSSGDNVKIRLKEVDGKDFVEILRSRDG